METKPAIKSTGVWGTSLATILGVVAILESDEVQAAACVIVPEYCVAVKAGIAAAIAVLGAIGVRGRMKATTQIKGLVK